MIEQKDVTIIIPHLGSSKEQEYSIEQCYLSLKETVPEIKKIISMNGIGKCQGHSWLEDVELVAVASQGQCKAVNAAVVTVSTPWVLVTNDDMVYPPEWFEKLSTFNKNFYKEEYYPECISPKLIEPRAGAPTFEVYFCGGAGGDFDKNKWLKFAEEYYKKGWNGTEVQGLKEFRTGFNLPFLIKKELWDLIGGYDINYDPWGSNGDSDLEYKIRLAGVQPYQNTNSIVYHFSQTSGSFSPDNRTYWDKNWHYFISKWGFPRADSPAIWEANFDIPKDKLKYRPWWKGFYNKNA